MSTLSTKQLAGYQRRKLRTLREQLLRMAAEWDGVDQFNLSELVDAANRLAGIAEAMVEEGGAA